MAKEKKSNVSAPSPKESESPEKSNPSKESKSPEKSPSSDPPPSPSKPPPPSKSKPPSPPPSSPPPSPSPSPPPPSRAPSPPPHFSPPPSKSSPPSNGSTPSPPPSSPPPPPPTQTQTPSPPPPSSSSPPSPPSSQSPNTDSPPPSDSPPSPQVTTPPSPGSYASPPLPTQTRPPSPQSPPVTPGSYAKPSAPSSRTYGPSKSPPSDNHTTLQHIGFTFAGVFAVAFVIVILFLVLRRKDKRGGNVYGSMQPPKKSQMKGDVHYYAEETGFVGNGTQDMFYSTTRNQAGTVQQLEIPPDPAQQQVSAGQIVFSYDKIVEITNGFSGDNVIGEGGFGRVYKASMPDGRVGAIKLLKAGSGQGEREFKAEVEIISRVHHRHLVSLIGYCISEQQRVLIYEFVPNGNLDQHLHASEKMVLDWPKRMKIAIGAARGLAYLHEGCNPKIIHRDIKSANILLDDSYEAQVADFGLARLTDGANTHVSTRVMGTFGYMAPEYATSGKLTDRSDVFSFGVVLLELVTGRKPVDPDQPVGDESLVEWARPLLLRAVETGDFSELVDPRLNKQYVDSEMFRMIEAAAACVRHSGPKRPSMVQIARALDSGDQLYDLSNGVKYGQSTVYDSGQYNEEIKRFNGRDESSFGDSEFDLYSREYSSADISGPARIPIQSSSDDSEFRIFQGQRSKADNNRS